MRLGRKDFLSIRDFTREELQYILDLAIRQKPRAKGFRLEKTHPDRVLACIFHKPSLRTRISFEIAIRQLGGSSLYITDREIGIGSREHPKDVGAVLSRYVDGIMIRTFEQKLADDLARNSTVPVINGLTDLLHPCQIMGDMMTVLEHSGSMEGKKVVFFGDGNNVARSWLNAACRFPFKLVLTGPRGYEIAPPYLEEAGKDGDPDYQWLEDPAEAIRDADVVYADVWASMGQESEKEIRLKVMQPYQINPDLMKLAREDALFMHCLPAHRGEEVTDEVIDGPNSIVFDQAENRLHVQRAIISLLIPGEKEL